MTAMGRSFTAFLLMPASWHVSTTDDTSCRVCGRSAARGDEHAAVSPALPTCARFHRLAASQPPPPPPPPRATTTPTHSPHLVALWCLLHDELGAGHADGDALGLQIVQHSLVVQLVAAVVAAACAACANVLVFLRGHRRDVWQMCDRWPRLANTDTHTDAGTDATHLRRGRCCQTSPAGPCLCRSARSCRCPWCLRSAQAGLQRATG
jgi:hypothetical protein